MDNPEKPKIDRRYVYVVTEDDSNYAHLQKTFAEKRLKTVRFYRIEDLYTFMGCTNIPLRYAARHLAPHLVNAPEAGTIPAGVVADELNDSTRLTGQDMLRLFSNNPSAQYPGRFQDQGVGMVIINPLITSSNVRAYGGSASRDYRAEGAWTAETAKDVVASMQSAIADALPSYTRYLDQQKISDKRRALKEEQKDRLFEKNNIIQKDSGWETNRK